MAGYGIKCECSNVIITIELNIEYQNVGEGRGKVTMYFVIHKLRILPQPYNKLMVIMKSRNT